MRIDTHVHITPPDVIANWERIAEKEAYFSLLSHSKNNHFATAEDVIAEMDKCGIDSAVVFPFAFADMGLCRYGNDYAMEAVKKYPDRLTGFMAVVPGQEAEREIARCYGGGLYGVGELFPKGQPFDLCESSDTDGLAHACMERNIPVLLKVIWNRLLVIESSAHGPSLSVCCCFTALLLLSTAWRICLPHPPERASPHIRHFGVACLASEPLW